jgi:pseudouridine kinase
VSVYSYKDGKEPFVLVFGAMAIDAKGKPDCALVPGTSTPGTVRLSIGGVARNIAENLARLGVRAVLFSAVGDDPIGHLLLDATAESGVDVEHVTISAEHRTCTYLAVFDRNGAPAHAIDDMGGIETLTPGLVYRNRALFRDASMIVLDANVPPRTMETIFGLAQRYDCPVCIDPASAGLAPRLLPHLSSITLTTPNLQEAKAIVRPQAEMDVQHMAMELVNMGIETAIITLAEMGLYYATSDERGRVPALQRDIVDLTGAGDALTAAVIFGLLNDFAIGEAVRLGISAAALTIQCPDTVCPNLSLDRLYDELVI